jgi:hypothetical protein
VLRVSQTPEAGRESTEREPWRLVAVFSVTQVLSWGTLYYTPAVLAAHVRAETGWSLPFVLGGFSAGILTSGIAAPFVGRWIDARGGRVVMASGSLVAAVALGTMAWATTGAGYYAAWAIAGLAMAATLYEAAFATLNQHFPVSFRRALTALTLVGGFASTVFWPLTHALAGTIGWRPTLVVFAGMHLAICLPLHAGLIPQAGDWRQRMKAAIGAAAPVIEPPRRLVVGLLATAFALNSLVSTGVFAQITLLFGAAGLTATQAVAMAALVGPVQVVGRVLEFTFAKRLTPVRLATLALAALPAAFVLVAAGGRGLPAVLVFAVLFGLSNGVMTIVRGLVPAALFGRERLATVLGLLGAPTLVARAAAPLVISAFIAGLADTRHVFAALGLIAAAAVVAFRLIPSDGQRSASTVHR